MSSELTVHTVPSARPGVLGRAAAVPFRRIVGMEVDEETVWVPQKDGYFSRPFAYDPAQTEPAALELTDSLALRARVFFLHFLAEAEYKPYNCHSFASFMEGGTNSAKNDFSVRQRLLGSKVVTAAWDRTCAPLAMGERGIIARIRSTGPDGTRVKALHSVIGLGEDNPDCLQVTQAQGFMALSSYESILGYYRPGRRSGPVGLYARQVRTRQFAILSG